MREDEELCKRSFDRYLEGNLCHASRVWRQGEDPPDYYLTLGGREFAVEVTSLMLALNTDSRSLPYRAYIASANKITKTVESRAIGQGILSGTYVTSFRGPFDDFGKIRGLVEKAALNYISDTRDLTKALYQDILPQGRTGCGIQKAHGKSDKVTCGMSSLGWLKWEGEIQAEASTLLRNAASTKRRKLEGVALPKILLLLNRYPFGGPRLYKECVRSSEMARLMECFHSVFVVQNEEDGCFLHTREQAWQWNPESSLKQDS